jgi:phosphopantothenoylcysteine decarboxylase/phosphopantothenate--cysteine ligase
LGKRILVSAGGTREPIDSVRFIGNRSSGRMGLALAERALARGAQVTLVAANVALAAPAAARLIAVQTAAELAEACRSEFEVADVLLMAAAVSDFRPRDPAPSKLKKDRGVPKLELEATPDVLKELAGARRAGQVLVGFAAEHGEHAIANARGKLERKGLDAVVLNDISQPGIGFDTEDNEVTMIVAGGRQAQVAKASKASVAEAVLDEVELLLAGKERDDRARAHPDRAARV